MQEFSLGGPISAAFAVFLFTSVASAQEATSQSSPVVPNANVFLETDPATFVLGGFAVHGRLRPASSPHWSLGVGAYALNLPRLMVDIDSQNRDLGWSSRIAIAGSLFVDHYFRSDGDGLFVGAQLGAQRFRVTRDGFAGHGNFTAVLAMPRVGYAWRPWGGGLYVMPWFGLGATTKIAGDPMVGDKKYDVFPLIAFATVHAGWRF